MWVECRHARQVTVLLIVMRKVPSKVQGVELSPLCPAVMLPECREDLRFGPGGCVSLHPRLVQCRNAFRHRLERACVFCLRLTMALVRVGCLECRRITLLLLLLLRRRRAPSLVPLFEWEVVPVWDQSWVWCEAHWLTLTGTHTGNAWSPAEAEEVLGSRDADSCVHGKIVRSKVITV